MTMNEISNFFEKGYTTKQSKDGRGLGLYHANQIAQKYNGNITVELREEAQTQEICFRVEI